MTSRSPSPVSGFNKLLQASAPVVPGKAKSPSVNGTPRRIALSTLASPSSLSSLGAVTTSKVEELPEASSSSTAGKLPLPRSTPKSTPATTPSRKGKEKEHADDTPERFLNGTATNRQVNGAASGSVNVTPKTRPNGTASMNGTPVANGTSTPKATKGRNSDSAGELDLSWPEPFASARRAAGLHNGSMACYTNATLQVLLHTPPVLRQALAHDPSNCILASRHKFCMLCAIRQIATTDHFSGKKQAYRPIPVHAHLGQIKKGFSKNRQEDTHEFFRFVTDAFQNTELAGKPKDLPEKIKHQTWVYRTWGGRVRSRVLCLSCRKPSDTFDSFLDLSLDVPKQAKSLADLFKVFIHEDKLDGENKYSCENCKKKSAATKSMRIAEAPPVLTLHLKRFGYSMTWPSRMTKVNNLIDYPQLLDIGSYMTEDATSGTHYKLFAVTCHHGSSLNYGHYTSYVRGPDNMWHEADDDSVSPVRISTVLHDKSAYLLSYMRVSKGSQTTPTATPTSLADATVATSSPGSAKNGFKRRRDEESPSPQKRTGPVRPPLAAAYGASNGLPKSPPAALSRLEKQYQSEDSEEENQMRQPKPRPHSHGPISNSPISRPPHPSPKSLKGKHHRVNHKQGIATLQAASTSMTHRKPKHGGLMPFSAGQMRGAPKSNARYNAGAREVLMKKKGILKRMRGKGQ